MEATPENGKESSHSAHENGMNEYLNTIHAGLNKIQKKLISLLEFPWHNIESTVWF
jgi:hypothetical protein